MDVGGRLSNSMQTGSCTGWHVVVGVTPSEALVVLDATEVAPVVMMGGSNVAGGRCNLIVASSGMRCVSKQLMSFFGRVVQ